jgi:hypothetical protein
LFCTQPNCRRKADRKEKRLTGIRAAADASVSQSALEEALLSRMQQGSVASKMSTLSQALKSKYL